jgi:acylglycerol lipase
MFSIFFALRALGRTCPKPHASRRALRGDTQLLKVVGYIFYRLLLLSGLLCLAACQLPQIQPLQPLQHPPELLENKIRLGDGALLPLKCWETQRKNPSAIILALHGFNDYHHAFDMPAAYFAEEEITTCAYDQRGFGATAQRGIWAGQENLLRDLKQAVLATSSRYPNTPLYLLGESMGAAVVVAATAEADFPKNKVAGVILSAPALWGENTLNPLHRFVLWLVVHQYPSLRMTGKGLKIQASDNIEMLRALGRDPLIIKGTRVDAMYGLVQLMDIAHARISSLPLPTLMLYGQKDQVIPALAIGSAMYQLQKIPVEKRNGFRAVYYQHGWHMLLRDLQRKRVWNDVVAWIKSPQAPFPSSEEVTPENFWQKSLIAPHSQY